MTKSIRPSIRVRNEMLFTAAQLWTWPAVLLVWSMTEASVRSREVFLVAALLSLLVRAMLRIASSAELVDDQLRLRAGRASRTIELARASARRRRELASGECVLLVSTWPLSRGPFWLVCDDIDGTIQKAVLSHGGRVKGTWLDGGDLMTRERAVDRQTEGFFSE